MAKRTRFGVVISLFFVAVGGWLLLHLVERSSFLDSGFPDADEWMLGQIKEDFAYFRMQEKVSKKEMERLASSKDYKHLQLVKFTIKDNRVKTKKNFSAYSRRVGYIEKALKEVCQSRSLPDMEFIVSMHDEVGAQFDVPLFVMAKNRHNAKQILIPDFEALRGKYQVLKKGDITKETVDWNAKKNQLIWRGSTAQRPLSGSYGIDATNIHSFSRVRLCELSLLFPRWIDAKFTLYVKDAKKIPILKKFRGNFVSFEEQLNYKYHLLVDGNTCAYSASGWKWFSNSLLFKADSDSVQWYYGMLRPYEHYIPVRADLDDLIDKIHWAEANDGEAQAIAKRARDFALGHIIKKLNMAYLYQTLMEYSSLNFVD